MAEYYFSLDTFWKYRPTTYRLNYSTTIPKSPDNLLIMQVRQNI